MKLQIEQHPEEVIEVDPEIIAIMKARLAEPSVTVCQYDGLYRLD
jgi:hypothetical protein